MVVAEPESPPWWKRVVPKINRDFVMTGRPIRLQSYATSQLPDPAQWRDCIVKDSTLNAVVMSDGTAWNAI